MILKPIMNFLIFFVTNVWAMRGSQHSPFTLHDYHESLALHVFYLRLKLQQQNSGNFLTIL